MSTLKDLQQELHRLEDLIDFIEKVVFDPELEDLEKLRKIADVLKPNTVEGLVGTDWTYHEDIPDEDLKKISDYLIRFPAWELEYRDVPIQYTTTNMDGVPFFLGLGEVATLPELLARIDDELDEEDS